MIFLDFWGFLFGKMNDKLICPLCKKNQAVHFTPNGFGICDACFIEIQLSFSYYVGGKEVTREEYKRKINE